MAVISLGTQVFVASSSDVAAEREAAERVIEAAARRAVGQRILLRPFLWESRVAANAGHPQPPLSDELKRSDFVVVIVGSRLGPGTREELRLSLEMFRTRRLDNVAIYFKEPESDHGVSEQAAEVRSLHRELVDQNLALTRTFRRTEEFRDLLHRQLDQWLDDYWYGLPAIYEFALRNSAPLESEHQAAEARWRRIDDLFDWQDRLELCRKLGGVALDLYHKHGEGFVERTFSRDAVGLAVEWDCLVGDADAFEPGHAHHGEPAFCYAPAPTPLRREADGRIAFGNSEWGYFFCSFGLVDAVLAANSRPLRSHPFSNPIHQYLKANVSNRNIDLTPTLKQWLIGNDGARSSGTVLRGFAAYVLGMVEAFDADDTLAEVLQFDCETEVRMYCAMSLGKLQSRRHRPILIRLFQMESDPAVRLMIAQAVCRIAGLVQFEL